MANNIKVSKEDFKRYMNECPKIAWIFHSINNFKHVIELKNKKIIETHYKVSLDNEEDWDTSSGFNAIDLYSDLLEKSDNELTKSELAQKEILIKQMEDINGFEISGLPAETIVDGNAVGEAAREYFIEELYKENIKNKTNYEYLDFQEKSYQESIEETKEALRDNKIKYLFEPSFEYMNEMLKVRCDILINHGNRHVTIVEFKASTTSKAVHFFDVMYQKKVLEKNGYIIDDVKIGLINKNYVRGIGIDENRSNFSIIWRKLDFEKDIKPFLNNLFIPKSDESDLNYKQLIRITTKLETSKKDVGINEMIIGMEENGFDFDEKILEISKYFQNSENIFSKECEKVAFEYAKKSYKMKKAICHHVVPYYDKEKFNLYELTSFKPKAAIIHSRKSDNVYIENISNFKDELFFDKNKLLFGQDELRILQNVKSYLKNGSLSPAEIIKENSYDTLINLLKDYYKYPVYMYDFETVKWAVPKYDNSWSYEQIPFQYSIHVINNPDYDFNDPKNTMEHLNFIANKQEDPRPEFLFNFVKNCFAYGPGIYVAYNKSFERSVIKNLIYSYPEFSAPLEFIYNNTIDLMEFFKKAKNNWIIYHPNFRGSYSIKKTQPALDHSLSYKDLKINKGDKASQTFRQFLDNVIDQQEYEIILKEDMLKYCDRDTLAMIVVLQRVVDIVKQYNPDFIKDINRLLEEEKNV
ncbi:DUF2779 domain-containing protein [Spiroplasma floricola]|uniref:DUF2779 domain-containing protein n=1 Tax=Spiroplasma floricola 23-6 TaxID=1336749 RepID=A0A2K8SD89_9MOLU|nr:DUF2779 domain-containing protein [Spiroplasma floricola]AUB31429.1 hypothetical protein SFLOR_v1c03720 [Spiroplasma floricola 23-6]